LKTAKHILFAFSMEVRVVVTHGFSYVSGIETDFARCSFQFGFKKIDLAAKSRCLNISEDLIKKIGVWITACQ